MHVAFFTGEYPTPTYPAGGLANYLKKNGAELSRRGHRVTIFFLSSTNKVWNDGHVTIIEIKTARKIIAKFIPIPGVRIFARIIWNIHNAWLLRKFFYQYHKKDKFTIVQVPLLPHGGAMALFLLFGPRPVPIVGRLSFDTLSFQQVNRENLQSISYRTTTRLERWQIKKLDGVFGPCRKIAKIVEERESLNVKVIRTPLEVLEKSEAAKSIIQKLPVTKPYFLYFSQFEIFKGFDIAVEASELILKKFSNVSVLFVGTPKQNSASQWVKKLLELESIYHNRIKLLPPQPKDKLYPLIQKSEAVLMPARLDNYPNACLEALALGTIVIGTYDSSLDEIIIHQKTGFLVPKDNVKIYYKMMKSVMNMSTQKRKMITDNINEYYRRVHQEDRIGALLDYYSTIIKKYQ